MVSMKSNPKQRLSKIAAVLTIILLSLMTWCVAGILPANRGRDALDTASHESRAASDEWSASYKSSLDQAKAKKMPVLIKFEAAWCVWCEKMEEEVFTDPEVKKELEKFVCVKIDVDKQENIAKAYKIRSLPRTIVINTYNEIVGDWLGYYEADVYYKLLRDVDEYTHIQTGITRVPSIEATTGDSNGTNIPEIDPNNTIGLIGLLGHRNAGISRRVTDILIQIGPKVLPDVVPALESKYLGTRIAAWKVIRELTGSQFKFDPWSPTSERAQAAKTIKEKLLNKVKSD